MSKHRRHRAKQTDDLPRTSLSSSWPAGGVLLSLITCAAYLPAMQGAFIWDDYALISNNDLVKSPSGLYDIWFTTKPIDYWPLTNTSFWIEWRLWGTNPLGYHATNLLLHAGSALLLWAILKQLAIPGAWLAALLFAVHPVNVESVAWIAQRKNTLSMFFFLLSVFWYLKGEPPPPKQSSAAPAVGRWYWLSLVAFTLAMLSKGSVAILPLVLLGLAWWQRARIESRDLLRSLPYFLIAAALTAVNIWFQTHGGEQIRDATIGQRVLGAAAIVGFYLYKAVVPLDLLFVYPQWKIDVGDLRWWLPLLAAVGATALLVWRRRTPWGRALLFAWGFFCVALLPAMGFVDVYFMKYSLVADHYQYIAIIAVVALVAAGFAIWHGNTRSGWYAVPVAAVLTGALTVLTWQQAQYYADTETIYEATLLKNPDSWMAHYNLANTLLQKGHTAEAAEHFRQTLRLKTDDSKVYNNLGSALLRMDRPQEAIDQFAGALALDPEHLEARSNLGNALASLGRLDEAIAQYQAVLRLKSDHVPALANLTTVYAMAKRPSEAIATAEKAIEAARAQGQEELARKTESWLRSYRAKTSGLERRTDR